MPAVLANNLIAHGQSQPQPTGFSGTIALYLIKALENSLLMLRSNACTVIGYGQGHCVVLTGQGDHDLRLCVADSVVEQAGTSRAVNVVLMGVISHILDFGDKVWNDALEQCVPAKVLEVNKKAFGLGRNA